MLSNLHEYALGLMHRKQQNWTNEDLAFTPFDCNLYYDQFMQVLLQYSDNLLLKSKHETNTRKLIYNINDLHQSIGDSAWLFPYDKSPRTQQLNDLHFYLMLSAILCNAYHIFSGYIKANKYPSLYSTLPKLKLSQKRMKLLFAQLAPSDWLLALQTNICNNKLHSQYKYLINKLPNTDLGNVIANELDKMPEPVTRLDECYLHNILNSFVEQQDGKPLVLNASTLSYLIRIGALNKLNMLAIFSDYIADELYFSNLDLWRTECNHFQLKAHEKLTNYNEICNCFKMVTSILNKTEAPSKGTIELEGKVKDIMQAIYNIKEKFSPRVNGREDMTSLVHHMTKSIRIKAQNKNKFLEENTILTYLKNLSADY